MPHQKTIADVQHCSTNIAIDRDLIIAHVLIKERTFILAHPEHTLTEDQSKQITSLIKKRESGEPLAYLLGSKEFYGLDFAVTPDTLIPRPETELIIDLVVAHAKKSPHNIQKVFIDVGTGSGNIIITLAKQFVTQRQNTDNYQFFATDISPKALAIAKENAHKHNVDKNISFFEGNLLTPLMNSPLAPKLSTIPSLAIIANLPYVDEAIKETLLCHEESQGLAYEPAEALWSQENGLAHYKELLMQTKALYLNDTQASSHQPRTNYYEINPDQKELLQKAILEHFPTATITFHKDLADKWRICEWSL